MAKGMWINDFIYQKSVWLVAVLYTILIGLPVALMLYSAINVACIAIYILRTIKKTIKNAKTKHLPIAP